MVITIFKFICIKNKRIIELLYFNSLKILFKLIPYRGDKRILMFGTTGGRYCDNSKAIFEYVISNKNIKKGIKPFWVTKNKKFKKENGNVIPILWRWSPVTVYYAMNSEYFFVTHSQDDIVPIKGKNTKIVNLWHGSPLKLLGFDSNVSLKNIRIKKLFKLKLEYNTWDYFIVASDIWKKVFISAYKLMESQILATGLPRNDILVKYKKSPSDYDEKITNLKDKFNIRCDDKVILYVPTYRLKQTDIFNKLINNNEVISYLKEKKIKILIRYHLFENSNDSGFSSCFIDVSNYNDIEFLYMVSDVLMTDYSSAIFDFCILRRPVIFYTPDIEEYSDCIGGFYFDFPKSLPKEWFSNTPEEFISILENIESYAYDDFLFSTKINNIDASKLILNKLGIIDL